MWLNTNFFLFILLAVFQASRTYRLMFSCSRVISSAMASALFYVSFPSETPVVHLWDLLLCPTNVLCQVCCFFLPELQFGFFFFYWSHFYFIISISRYASLLLNSSHKFLISVILFSVQKMSMFLFTDFHLRMNSTLKVSMFHPFYPSFPPFTFTRCSWLKSLSVNDDTCNISWSASVVYLCFYWLFIIWSCLFENLFFYCMSDIIYKRIVESPGLHLSYVKYIGWRANHLNPVGNWDGLGLGCSFSKTQFTSGHTFILVVWNLT